jgi:hypothetical protein
MILMIVFIYLWKNRLCLSLLKSGRVSKPCWLVDLGHILRDTLLIHRIKSRIGNGACKMISTSVSLLRISDFYVSQIKVDTRDYLRSLGKSLSFDLIG